MPKGKRVDGAQNIGIGTVLYHTEKLQEVAKSAVFGEVEFRGKDKNGEFFKLVGNDTPVRRSDLVKYTAGDSAARRVLFPTPVKKKK